MPNPWLDVPLADYEGHMSAPEVQQLSALSDLFADALAFCCPASLAILGVAGGNGLDRIDLAVTTRILGIDLNPSYLDTVRSRYPHVHGLELCCLNLAEQIVDLEPVELVHAALIFEHAGTSRCLENAVRLVEAGGALSVVLQMPSEGNANVAPTPFPSMQNLKSHFTLVDPAPLRDSLERRNYRLVHETRCSLPAGKAFWLGVFQENRPK
jgi:hypothetical protein